MRNIWHLFVGDLKRMGGNTITIITILGLVALPSLFSWFNMLACWNVFDNTGHLTVAVANSDDGYESDLIPINVNIGEEVLSALRANDQLNWVFTDEDDAIEGTRSGRYYAAVVIPSDFSQRMMTFYQSDSSAALLTYYSNEKKSAIAPKVTDKGADQVSNQVNRVFSETLSEIALGLSSSLDDYATQADAEGNIANLAQHLERLGNELARTADTLRLYAATVETTQTLVVDSATLLQQTRESADQVAQSAKDAVAAADSAATALEQAAQELGGAVDSCVSAFAEVPSTVSAAFDSTDAVASDSASVLRDVANSADAQATELRNNAATLRELEALLTPESAQIVENAAVELDSMAAQHEQIRDSLNEAATAIENEDAEQIATREEVESMLAQSVQALNEAKVEYDTNLKPTLDELTATLAHAANTLRDTGGRLENVGGSMSGTASSLSDQLGSAKADLEDAASNLDGSSDEIVNLSNEIQGALASNDSAALKRIIGQDPHDLANALSAPVTIERTAVYPVENFGSAMTPLYTSLALWIGSLLMMVTLMANPSRRIEEELDNPTPRQLFIGRFGIIAVISLMQSTMLYLGNMFFLEVQAVHPFLYLLCYWVSGLVFAFIIYTLVSCFANLGKAISVVLLILQVSGGGGSFPLQLLPEFFQVVSPYLPLTHMVNAMRAAMFGVYAGDFWTEMGVLLLFAVPLVFFGLVFRGPLVKVTSAFMEKVEKSKLM